ncbi:MAG: hypothetical protein A2096_15365 [Spirochaetes bacterium GWF1_41_5]|nr:MAG: hypothetical protein A2096_15365 [Spirochaetes bacterium GWF1_41_5]
MLKKLQKNKFIFYISAAILVLTVFTVFLLLKNKGKPLELIYTRPQTGNIAVYHLESGILISENSVNITAPQVQKFKRLLISIIPEGSIVKSGDIIARFDTSDILTSIESEEIALANESAGYNDTDIAFDIKIKDLAAKLSNEVENEKIARITYDSMQFAPELEKQKGMVRLNQAKAAVRIAENRIAQEENRKTIQLRQIESKMQGMRAKISEYKNYLEMFTVRAPKEGLVVYPVIKISGSERKAQIGDTLYYGQLFLEIPNLFKMAARAEINEENINKISSGMKAELELEAFKEKKYTGYIKYISKLAQVKDNNPFVKVFEIIIKINENDINRLKPGMNVKIKIFLFNINNARSLPLDFVEARGSELYIILWQNDSFVEKIITAREITSSLVVLEDKCHIENNILLPGENLSKAMSAPRPNSRKIRFIQYSHEND